MAKGSQSISGILLLNKPLKISSNKALQKVKSLYDAKKAGHTGSLDPLASGMLPICFGDASKYSQYLLDSDKVYETTAKLGITTTTGDAEGEILESKPFNPEIIHDAAIEAVLSQFTGPIEQIPPMHSALKHNGQPLYKLARKGETIERKARAVTIYKIDCLGLEEDQLHLKVHCSKGTYIRTLVEDIGAALGCGAHVSRLHRTWVSPFDNEKMIELNDLLEMTESDLSKCLLPIDSAVSTLPKIKLNGDQIYRLQTGQPLTIEHATLPSNQEALCLTRLYSADNTFLGIGHLDETGQVVKRRLLSS